MKISDLETEWAYSQKKHKEEVDKKGKLSKRKESRLQEKKF